MWVQGGSGVGCCVDQIFVVRQFCEKFLANGREVYLAFMGLKKAYGEVDRRALWQVVSIRGAK